MSFVQKIYDVSPVFIQHGLISLSGYLRNRSRYGKEYYEELTFLKDFDNKPFDEKLIYQNAQLSKFVETATQKSEFYRRYYENIDAKQIKCQKDLRKLPLLDKETLRQNILSFFTVSNTKGVESHTGGTTGKSLTVRYTKRDRNKRMAMLDHFKARVGFHHLKMKRATFNGKHIIPPNYKGRVFWRYNAACKQMIFSSFHLSENNMSSYVEGMNKFKPDAIDGFFTCILDLANFIERHNIKLSFTPKAIFPTSETLTAMGRVKIEKVFGCKVYDQYASSEGAPFVTECSHQNLHMEMASGVIENINSKTHEIAVTSFTTEGTPLIRYAIGDSMIFESLGEFCPCGMESIMVKSIQGRKLDYLYTSSGAKVNAGNVSNLFKNVPNAIIRAQLIQYNYNEVSIMLEVDKERYKATYDEVIIQEFRHKFDENMKLTITHVEALERESSGKFRFIKNYVTERHAKRN